MPATMYPALLFTLVAFLLQGCEQGTDPVSNITPNYHLLLTDCESQPDCSETYPHLAAHFQELATRLPTSVTINHPKTGVPFTAEIDPHLINRLVRAVMYDRTLSRLLPLAIEEAFNGNYTSLSTLAYTLTGEDNQLSTGMMASVLCSEDMKLVDAPYNTAGFDNALYESLVPTTCFFYFLRRRG